MIFDARYSFIDQDITITMGKFEDQVDYVIFPETLFRLDGSVQIFRGGGGPPNTTCAEAYQNIGTNGYTLQQWDGYGCTPSDPTIGHITPEANASIDCPRTLDFDGNGQVDRCYTMVTESPSGQTEALGTLVVQAGDIDLTAFSVAIGARIHF
jgi:hypothetical protein